MTDNRSLLEAAAKAAGVKGWWADDRVFPYVDDQPWNPLTDDGDALRLAVKLRLRVDSGYCGCADVRGYMVDATEALGHDPYAATRRAIVRAATAMAEKTR